MSAYVGDELKRIGIVIPGQNINALRTWHAIATEYYVGKPNEAYKVS